MTDYEKSPLICPVCEYNLTGLAENRCPECGQPFDPVKLRRPVNEPELTGLMADIRPMSWPTVLFIQLIVAALGTVATVLIIAASAFGGAAPMALPLFPFLMLLQCVLANRHAQALALNRRRKCGLGVDDPDGELYVRIVRPVILFIAMFVTYVLPFLVSWIFS